MHAGVIFVLIIVVRALAHIYQSRGGAARTVETARTARTWRATLWWLLFLGWVLLSVLTLAATLSLLQHDAVVTSADLLGLTWMLAVVGVGLSAFVLAWPILRALARRGWAKLVYRLAHAVLLFPNTGETYSGACLLALLALAHRGDVTAEERDWVKARLRKETRHLGTYATACALHLLLEARAARDDGRLREAHELVHRARIVLGTVTYVSDRGVPAPVRKIVWELLGLDDARLGRWGSLEIAPEAALTPLAYVLRAWTRERLMDKPSETKTARVRRRLRSSAIEKLFARPETAPPPREEARAVWARARRDFLVLARGGSIGPRSMMNLLVRFDLVTHPEFPETILPEAIRSDEELVASIHDDIAGALTEVVLREGAPLFALKAYGPISARVYQRVEAELFGEMDRTLRRLDERTKAGRRGDGPFEEWLEASQIRSLYRRIEMALGPEAAANVYPHFAFTYCNLGVMLSETQPRMRPLAHAIFKCLSGEATQFDDKENIKQQEHNMKVTAGAD